MQVFPSTIYHQRPPKAPISHPTVCRRCDDYATTRGVAGDAALPKPKQLIKQALTPNGRIAAPQLATPQVVQPAATPRNPQRLVEQAPNDRIAAPLSQSPVATPQPRPPIQQLPPQPLPPLPQQLPPPACDEVPTPTSIMLQRNRSWDVRRLSTREAGVEVRVHVVV